ncbi:hypothetical protein [Herbiconiux solani]|uniref:hypothetical protein n=1 Tax=Herbiconiux solani TaxID=661329 RepID=UPI000825CBE5|nr:hypothetical protein [Herbiconiux solani]
MTLTSILPSLRSTIPDPLAIDRWPEWTHPTTTDVIVSGVSLLRLVDICETPCVHVAAAVVPGTHGRPSDREQASVVVVRVTGVSDAQVESVAPVLTFDAELDALPAHLEEARLIGRSSTRRSQPFLVGGSIVSLPSDTTVDDLIAVPCAGAVGCRQLRVGAGVGVSGS